MTTSPSSPSPAGAIPWPWRARSDAAPTSTGPRWRWPSLTPRSVRASGWTWSPALRAAPRLPASSASWRTCSPSRASRRRSRAVAGTSRPATAPSTRSRRLSGGSRPARRRARLSVPVRRPRVAAHRERRVARVAVALEHAAAVALAGRRALAARVALDRDERAAHHPLDQADMAGHALLGVEHEVAGVRRGAGFVPAPALDAAARVLLDLDARLHPWLRGEARGHDARVRKGAAPERVGPGRRADRAIPAVDEGAAIRGGRALGHSEVALCEPDRQLGAAALVALSQPRQPARALLG